MTISNVVNVSLYELNLQARTMGSWANAAANARPLLVQASGKVVVETSIDNADRGGGSLSGQDVSVYGREVTVNNVYTFSARTSSQTGLKAGNIVLKALQPPDYLTANVNNTPTNKLTVAGEMRADCAFSGGVLGLITTESVVLQFGPAAVITGPALSTNLSVGKIQNGAVAGDLFINQSAGSYTASYVVDWSGPSAPVSPMLLVAPAPPGQIVLRWSGDGFVLQQNSDLSTPGGWVNAPTGTANPATNAIGAGKLFYRLKWPQ
jgi:hypothetical protein